MSDVWAVDFHKDARKEFNSLDGSQKNHVAKAIEKVSQNPLPANEGGYGKPLVNKGGVYRLAKKRMEEL